MTEITPQSSDELIRRLPEITTLENNVRDETIRIFMEDVPEYFWLARASENHHPPDERGLGGVWLHTKRVFSVWTMIENSYRAMNLIDPVEAQSARAATLLHDAYKYGLPPFDEDEDHHEYADGRLSGIPEWTQSDHDTLMAETVRESNLPEEVAMCVESHGGSPSWTSHDGPGPSNDLTLGVHLADAIASNASTRTPVMGIPSNEREPEPVVHRALRNFVNEDIPTMDEAWVSRL